MMSKEEFNQFNQQTPADVQEDIAHRVACGVSVSQSINEIVHEQEKVGQILSYSALERAYYRGIRRLVA